MRPIRRLIRPAFAAWLATLADDEPAGTSGEACACPLAAYLRAKGNPRAAVGVDRFYLEYGSVGVPLPRWARRLASAVDTFGLTGTVVPAADVRRLLAAIA